MGHDLDDQELEATKKLFKDKPKNIEFVLSEEEKQSIEVINEKIEDINNMPINTKNKSTIKFLVEVQKVANELVDIANEIIIRQQKEIEDLKSEKRRLIHENQELKIDLLDY